MDEKVFLGGIFCRNDLEKDVFGISVLMVTLLGNAFESIFRDLLLVVWDVHSAVLLALSGVPCGTALPPAPPEDIRKSLPLVNAPWQASCRQEYLHGHAMSI